MVCLFTDSLCLFELLFLFHAYCTVLPCHDGMWGRMGYDTTVFVDLIRIYLSVCLSLFLLLK